LDRVEQGEEIVITRRGKPAARLAPCAPAVDRRIAMAALDRIRARARSPAVVPVRWEALRRTGTSGGHEPLVACSASLAWVCGEETTEAIHAVFGSLGRIGD
jgi:prevent-host-death family protein